MRCRIRLLSDFILLLLLLLLAYNAAGKWNVGWETEQGPDSDVC